MAIFKGRYTARVDGDFVVFLIGARINSFWKVHKWFRVMSAMPPMIKKLESDPSLGYLGQESFYRFGPLTSILVSYWKSFDHIEQFAKDPALPHHRAWGEFMKHIGSDGSVGIWHETYRVKAGQFECVYGNMPPFGLAKAFTHIPVAPAFEGARQRIDGV